MSKKLLGIVLLCIAVGSVLAYRAGVFNKPSSEHTSSKAIYYCPMHPTYTSDRPGDCPICNMKLVKRQEDAAPAAGSMEGSHHDHGQMGAMGNAVAPRTLTVKELMSMKPGDICLLHKCKMGMCTVAMTEEFARLGKCPMCGDDLGVVVKDVIPQGYAKVALTPEKQQMIGIKTSVAGKQRLSKTIRTAGRIAHDRELYQTQEEHIQNVEAFRRAKASGTPELVTRATRLMESSRQKLKLSGLGEELIKEVEASSKPDQGLLYGDLGGNVWLYASVYEYEIPLVKVGDTIQVELPAVLDKKFEGKIRSIDPVLDPMTRAVRVRAQLPNPDGTLKPEMYVNASIRVDMGEHLAVPEEAVFATGDKNIVFVAKPDGTFEPREVVVGSKADGFAEIKNGVGDGETVVTSGNFLIDSESRLKGALEGMDSSGHQHGQ